MKYYYHLYLSKVLQTKKDSILAKLGQNQIQFNRYLIVLTCDGKNQLEIFDSIMLRQEYFRNQVSVVVGIADGYQEALEVVRQITDEVYSAQQNVNIREYLLDKQQKYEEGVEV